MQNKIYILGLAGSGKTTLAKELQNSKINIFSTDWLLYNKDENHKRIKLSKEEYLKRVNKVINKSNWIIEGVHYFEEIAEAADLIVFIDTPLIVNIFRLLKRHITNKQYRKSFEFKATFSLIRKTIANYFLEPDIKLLYYPKYKNRKKYVLMLLKYKHKVKKIRNNELTLD